MSSALSKEKEKGRRGGKGVVTMSKEELSMRREMCSRYRKDDEGEEWRGGRVKKKWWGVVFYEEE